MSQIAYYGSTIEVNSCYQECPFYRVEGYLMKCGHESLKLHPNEQSIITQTNSKGRVPEECPLNAGDIKLVQEIGLSKINKERKEYYGKDKN